MIRALSGFYIQNHNRNYYNYDPTQSPASKLTTETAW